MSSARIRSTATIGRNMREDPMIPAESRPQAVCARSCALRFAEMLERDAHRVKRIEDTGRNTVRFVDPDSVPRIRDQLEPVSEHPCRCGPTLVHRREGILLTPNERRWDTELGPPLVKQERREEAFLGHDAIQIPAERAMIAEEIEPIAVEVFLGHAFGVRNERR